MATMKVQRSFWGLQVHLPIAFTLASKVSFTKGVDVYQSGEDLQIWVTWVSISSFALLQENSEFNLSNKVMIFVDSNCISFSQVVWSLNSDFIFEMYTEKSIK